MTKPRGNSVAAIPAIIVDSVSGIHRVNGEFIRVDAAVADGVITVTMHRYDFEGEDETVQLFISSPVPVVAEQQPDTAA